VIRARSGDKIFGIYLSYTITGFQTEFYVSSVFGFGLPYCATVSNLWWVADVAYLLFIPSATYLLLFLFHHGFSHDLNFAEVVEYLADEQHALCVPVDFAAYVASST